MIGGVTRAIALLTGDPRADRVVPPSGATARLTVCAAAAMAFLAVFALALSLATGRLADRWSEALAQTQRVLDLLAVTPGVASARALDAAETRALLAPWFGADLPVETLPIPQLVELREDGAGFDAEGLRLRLAAEVPGAALDDHARWRRPLVAAAERLRLIGLLSLGLIGSAAAVMVTLAARAALAANGQVIRVLRLIGARDAYLARAFVRRVTLRTLGGASAGTALGVIAVASLPRADEAGAFLTGLGFSGTGWLWPLAIPPVAAIVAFWATREAALRTLRGVQ